MSRNKELIDSGKLIHTTNMKRNPSRVLTRNDTTDDGTAVSTQGKNFEINVIPPSLSLEQPPQAQEKDDISFTEEPEIGVKRTESLKKQESIPAAPVEEKKPFKPSLIKFAPPTQPKTATPEKAPEKITAVPEKSLEKPVEVRTEVPKKIPSLVRETKPAVVVPQVSRPPELIKPIWPLRGDKTFEIFHFRIITVERPAPPAEGLQGKDSGRKELDYSFSPQALDSKIKTVEKQRPVSKIAAPNFKKNPEAKVLNKLAAEERPLKVEKSHSELGKSVKNNYMSPGEKDINDFASHLPSKEDSLKMELSERFGSSKASHPESELKEVRSIAVDTIDLRHSRVTTDLTPDHPRESIPVNKEELRKNMETSMKLREAMSVKFMLQKLTFPLPTVARSLEPDIPTMKPRITIEENQRSREQMQPIQREEERRVESKQAEKIEEKGDEESQSQKTRTFRIKDKKTNEESMKRELSQKRPSISTSEKSDVTKKGGKMSRQSTDMDDISEKERLLNNEMKKTEPLIIKYLEMSKWNSDRDKMRKGLAEKFKQISPFFGSFSVPFIENMLTYGSILFFPKEHLLYDDGEVANRMGILIYGLVQFNCNKGLVSLTHGGLVGEEVLLRNEPVRMTNTMILSKTCMLALDNTSMVELRKFSEQSKKRNEYILMIAQLQKQLKMKS
jgi:hypothetical protein